MKIAILCVAVLALIQTVLGICVSACRRKYGISAGCPDDPAHMLFRVRTAFSNCAEWHPLLSLLMLLNGYQSGQKWLIWLYPGVVAARCLLIMGLVTAPIKRPTTSRFLGAGLTYLLAIVLSLKLLSNFLPS